MKRTTDELRDLVRHAVTDGPVTLEERTVKKPKPRKRLRRKAKKPKPWVRMDLQDGYRKSVTWDELEPLLDSIGCDSWLKFKANNPPGRLELHHLLRRPRQRPDCLGNYLMLSGRAHDWVHENPIAGRIAVLYQKAVQTHAASRLELLEEWHWSFGRCPLAEVEVRLQRGEVPESWVDCGHMLLELFSTAPHYEPDDDEWIESAVDWDE